MRYPQKLMLFLFIPITFACSPQKKTLSSEMSSNNNTDTLKNASSHFEIKSNGANSPSQSITNPVIITNQNNGAKPKK
jgi:hypothetical protein